jgi:hypothetical protein
MPDDLKAWQIRQAANEVLWHIRLAAITLRHALGPWSGVAAVVRNAPAKVQNERARCMNIVGALCLQLNTFLNIMSGREERFDPQATIERLIEYFDVAMADLKVSRLRRIRENAARYNRTT